MKEKVLIFIPYQDTDNFFSDGIMTREYAMLYLLAGAGYRTVINIKKPRTLLDKKRYTVHNEYYPEGTKEAEIKKILDRSETIQYMPFFSIDQITKRRGWWSGGYKKTINKIRIEEDKDYLIYSDNPYAAELICNLAKQGCKIYFDIMDNFAIHPSLNKNEQEAALRGYRKIFGCADYISANSVQTCKFMQEYADKEIYLVKNGVFADNEAKNSLSLPEVLKIREAKKQYTRCVGYVGKLGLRLDADLIDEISKKCKDTLFVFVGGYLKGQINGKLINVFKKRDNVLHIGAVPSAYVYPILNEFDILSIPHSVGKAENGGDPLKLYQYLTRNKPIITTSILGVDEFKDNICITNDAGEWVSFIQNALFTSPVTSGINFTWADRILPILKEMGNDS